MTFVRLGVYAHNTSSPPSRTGSVPALGERGQAAGNLHAKSHISRWKIADSVNVN
jgi:hypothetical protein